MSSLLPVTVPLRGRPHLVSVADLRAELEADGPPRSLVLLEAVIRCNDPVAAIARLRRLIGRGDPGGATLRAVFGLVRLDAREAAGDLLALAAHLGGSPGAIARAASFLVDDRVAELARAAAEDELRGRHSPQAYLHVSHVSRDAGALFAVWMETLRRRSPHLGVTALRAFLGDVSEAAFRALQRGAATGALLADADRALLVDTLCAELPGTTDFVAARAMAWLLGALEPGDETVRSAIERARGRFRDAEFQADCEAMLAGAPWPPRPPG